MTRTKPNKGILVNLTSHLSFSDGSPDSVIFAPNVKGFGRAWDGDFDDRTFLHFPALTINVCPPSNNTQSDNALVAASQENTVPALWLVLILVFVLLLRDLHRTSRIGGDGVTDQAARESNCTCKRPPAHAKRILEPVASTRKHRTGENASKLQDVPVPDALDTHQSQLRKTTPALRPELCKPGTSSENSSDGPRADALRLAQAKGSRRYMRPSEIPSAFKRPLQSTSAPSKTTTTTAPPGESNKAIPEKAAPQEQAQPVGLDDAISLKSSESTSSTSSTSTSTSASSHFTLSLEVMRAILGVDIAYTEALQRFLQALNTSNTPNSSEAGSMAPSSPTGQDMADTPTISHILQLLRDTAVSSRGSSIAVGTPGSNESVSVMIDPPPAVGGRDTGHQQTQISPSREQQAREQPVETVSDRKPPPQEEPQQQQPQERRYVLRNRHTPFHQHASRVTAPSKTEQATGPSTKPGEFAQSHPGGSVGESSTR